MRGQQKRAKVTGKGASRVLNISSIKTILKVKAISCGICWGGDLLTMLIHRLDTQEYTAWSPNM